MTVIHMVNVLQMAFAPVVQDGSHLIVVLVSHHMDIFDIISWLQL